MKILVVHNFHRKGSSSGDDTVVRREVQLLKSHGHEVMVFSRENSEIYHGGFFTKAKIALEIPWSRRNYNNLLALIKSFNPDLVHIHTFFPLLSPSIYHAVHKAGKPMVQSVHDFRFFCPAAFFFRNGKICEECPSRGLKNAIKNRCLRNSLSQTLVAALATKNAQKALRLISAFVVFTDFSMKKLVDLGIPREKVFVKPHFIPSQEDISPSGGYFLFLGRLGEEKGIRVLLKAWENLQIPLKIAGSGPLEEWVKFSLQGKNNIEFVGFLSAHEVKKALTRAFALIVPSLWYETFGLVVIEAFSAGVPVLASRVGALQDLVENGRTGFLFKRGEAEDLAEKAFWLWTHPEERDRMGREARRVFEEKYTAERNYRILMEIYKKAIEKHHRL